MAKYRKLKETFYNEETGMSYAELHTELGVFFGTAQLAEEDKNTASKFFGCWLAEMSANYQYFREKRKRIKAQIAVLDELYNKNYKKMDHNEAHIIAKKLLELEKEKTSCEDTMAAIRTVVKKEQEEREKYYKTKVKKD